MVASTGASVHAGALEEVYKLFPGTLLRPNLVRVTSFVHMQGEIGQPYVAQDFS